MGDVYIMIGCPGCGKSTFLRTHAPKDAVVVSRDEIRFSIIRPGEEYFSHEDEVYEELWNRINEALAEDKDVFVDQTSLTPRSRKWLIEHIEGYDYVNAIFMEESLDTCIARNRERAGTRAFVPEDRLRKMYSQLTMPTFAEGFHRIYKYSSVDNKITYNEEGF